jgi:predicted amidohydrolase
VRSKLGGCEVEVVAPAPLHKRAQDLREQAPARHSLLAQQAVVMGWEDL